MLRHETGHAIDDIAGEFVGARRINAIPQGSAKRELTALYNENNDPIFRGAMASRGDIPEQVASVLAQGSDRRNFTSKAAGYTDAEAPPELMAEALSAYMADPNAVMTGYLKTAACIREAVSEHPDLAPLRQAAVLRTGDPRRSLPQQHLAELGGHQPHAERCAAGIGDKVALRPRLAPARRVRAGGRPPFLAGTEAPSKLNRHQSRSSVAGRRFNRT
ncbi:monoamine oxidase [Methylorubrum zatmanii]|nr:monoamine oxidase [Methylorubrum zatmanii]MCP1552481.1 monoamine oxidase [Methylorubrum extorquens]MCP1581209.1 monoamine oxidase [Methylorubrum extorquens]